MKDPSGETNELVRRALTAAVSDYGQRALSSPQVLCNVFDDYLPNNPRLVDVLTAAAEEGVAQNLTQHLQQNLDINTAIQLTTSNLQDRRALDPAASAWAVVEFARALGHQVPDVPPPLASSGFTGSVPRGTAGRSLPGPGLGTPSPAPSYPPPSYPPPAGPPPSYPPPAGPTPSYPPPGGPAVGPPPGMLPPTVVTPPGTTPPLSPGWGGGGPGPGPGPGGAGVKKRKTGLILGGAIALAVIVVLGIIGAVASSSNKASTTTTGVTDTTVNDTTTTPTVPRNRTLTALLPTDVSNCMSFTNPPAGLDTAVTNRVCDDTNLGQGALVYGYQFASNGDYEAALLAYNNDKGFKQDTAGPSCPPTGSFNHGQSTWHDNAGDTGLLECLTVNGTAADTSDPVYIWTIPADNIIFEAIGADSSSFSTLDTWWTNNAQG